MAVRAEVLIIRSKDAQCGRFVGEQIGQSTIPGAGPVVVLHVPRVVCNGIERDLRTFGILHRVAHKSAHITGNVEAITIGGTEQNVVAHEIVHGEVQPDIALALDARVDPVHALLVDGVHHRVTRPHHLDAGTQRAAQGIEILVAGATPSAVVDGGAEQERRDVAVFLHEHRVNIVEQFSLLLTARTFAGNIVEEDSKRTNAEIIHLLEFLHEVVAIFRRPTNISAGVDGPVEVHAASVRTIHQFTQLSRFLFGIRIAPVLTVIGIVLRTVDIDVHLVATVEIELAQAMFVTPRTAVETLDRTAEGHIGPVLHGAFFHLSLGHHLAQGLHAIIKTAFVTADDHHFFLSDGQIIGIGVIGHQLPVLGILFIGRQSQRDTEGAATSFGTRNPNLVEGSGGIGLCEGISRIDTPFFRSSKKLTGRFDRLRPRIHIGHLRRNTAGEKGK